MNLLNIIVLIGIVLFLIIIIWYISTLNRLTRASVKIEESLSGIDIALAKRYEVLTKMIEVVKGYAKHEKEVLFEVVKLRKDMPLSSKCKANKAMDDNMKKINVIAENYPELKASENFKLLEKAILDVEEHLQASRRCYNSNVTIYNQLILSFPISIVAKNKKMTEKDFFEVLENEKENVKIEL